MIVANGEFNIGTGLTPVSSVTPFDPTLTGIGLVLSWSGATSNATARGTIQAGYGIAGSLGGTASVAGTSKDTGTSACQQGERDDAVIHALTTAGAAAGDATVAFTSAGFTVTPTNAFATNLIVKWWAISVPMLATVTAAEPAAPGTVQTTGLPRAPRLGILPIMGGVSSFASPSQVAADFNLSIGAFCKNPAGVIKNAVMAGASDDGFATTKSGTYVNVSECLARFGPTLSATILSRAACSAMGATTFDLAYAAVEGAGTHAFPVLLAFDGIYDINTLTCATNTTTDMVVTPGFKALGGLVAMSGNTTFSTLGTGSGSARHFFGMHSGIGTEHAIGTRDTNGQVGATCTMGADSGHAIFILNNAAVLGAGHITAIGDTTVTFRMTTATTAVVGWVLSVGDNPPVLDQAAIMPRGLAAPRWSGGEAIPALGGATALGAALENSPVTPPRRLSLRQAHGGEALSPSSAAVPVAWPGDPPQHRQRPRDAWRPPGGEPVPAAVAAGLTPWTGNTPAPGPRQVMQLRMAGGDSLGGLSVKPWPADQPPPYMRRIATIRHAGGEPIGFLALGWAGDPGGATAPRTPPPPTVHGVSIPALPPIKKTIGTFDAPGTPWRPRKAWLDYLAAMPLPNVLAAIASPNAPLFAVFDRAVLAVDFDPADLTIDFDDVTFAVDFD